MHPLRLPLPRTHGSADEEADGNDCQRPRMGRIAAERSAGCNQATSGRTRAIAAGQVTHGHARAAGSAYSTTAQGEQAMSKKRKPHAERTADDYMNAADDAMEAAQGGISDQYFLERMARSDELADHDGTTCGQCHDQIL